MPTKPEPGKRIGRTTIAAIVPPHDQAAAPPLLFPVELVDIHGEARIFQAYYDTCSPVSTITRGVLDVLQRPVFPATEQFQSITGQHIQYQGRAVIPFSLEGDKTKPEGVFYVLESAPIPVLLGRAELQQLPTTITLDGIRIFEGFKPMQPKRLTPSLQPGQGLRFAPELPTEEHARWRQMILEFQDAIFEYSGAIGLFKEHVITLELKSTEVPVGRTYRMGQTHKLAYQKLMQEYEDRGWVEPSTSPYASPSFLVPKRVNPGDPPKWRLVTDYREVNRCLRNPTNLVPSVQELLDLLQGATWFTLLDMASGYHNCPLAVSSRYLTAFATPQGTKQYRVLPFGLSPSPTKFHHAVETILQRYLRRCCLVYLDDVLVYAQNHRQLLDNTRLVLTELVAAGGCIGITKCRFGARTIKYLGNIVCAEGIRPNPEAVDAVLNYPRPTTVKQLQRFIGLATFVRRHYRDFASLEARIRSIMPAANSVKELLWTEEADAAFHQLKTIIADPHQLAIFDPQCGHALLCDASATALGVILVQFELPTVPSIGSHTALDTVHVEVQSDEESEERSLVEPMASQEVPVTIIGDLPWALQALIKGDPSALRPVEFASRVLTCFEKNYSNTERELQAIVWALTCKMRPYAEGRTIYIGTDHKALLGNTRLYPHTARLVHQFLKIASYDLRWFHVPGRFLLGPDALSRTNTTTVVAAILPSVPEDQRHKVILDCHHELGHANWKKVYDTLRQRTRWPRLRQTVWSVVSECAACRRYNYATTKIGGPLLPIWSSAPNQFLLLDLLPPLTSRMGKVTPLLAMDHFSRFAVLTQLTRPTGPQTAKQLSDLFLQLGDFGTVITDPGPQFKSLAFQSQVRTLNAHLHLGFPRAFRATGALERLVRSLRVSSAKMAFTEQQPEEFEELLAAVRAHNVTVHTAHRTTPYEAFLGVPPVLQVDQRFGFITPSNPVATDHLTAYTNLWVRRFNATTTQLRTGDRVYWYPPPATSRRHASGRHVDRRRYGPFTIIQPVDTNRFIVSDGSDSFTYPASQLLKVVH